ncbi:MAG: hypothetical protein AB1649_27460 [Chloroflexota bacterium]
MPGKPFPSDIVRQAQEVQSAWAQINATMAFGNLNAAALTSDITAATTIEAQISTAETQLTKLRNQRDALYVALWDKVKRVRNGVKANYGDDSTEYEMIGGTRVSERKSYTRRVAPTG